MINTALIGIDDGAIFNVFQKEMAHVVLRYIGHDFEADVATPLQHRDHWNFIGVLAIAGQHGSRIARPWFPAHKSLIYFADASGVSEFLPVRLVFGQREANPVHEEQSRLVGDLTVALHLPCAHALFAGTNAPKPIGPMPQRQFGCFVNRARAHGVLLAASTAAPAIAFIPPASAVFHLVNIGILAMRAGRRVAPALPFKKLNGSLFITTGFGQVLDKVRFRKLRMVFD